MAKRKLRLYKDMVFRTIYVQSKRTGKMMGRKRVTGYGDRTAVLRVRKNHGAEGQIVGRTTPISRKIAIRGSKARRGTTRRIG